jgi:hypothetical protein
MSQPKPVSQQMQQRPTLKQLTQFAQTPEARMLPSGTVVTGITPTGAGEEVTYVSPETRLQTLIRYAQTPEGQEFARQQQLVQSINQKLSSGQRLNLSEFTYLARHDPETARLYQESIGVIGQPGGGKRRTEMLAAESARPTSGQPWYMTAISDIVGVPSMIEKDVLGAAKAVTSRPPLLAPQPPKYVGLLKPRTLTETVEGVAELPVTKQLEKLLATRVTLDPGYGTVDPSGLLTRTLGFKAAPFDLEKLAPVRPTVGEVVEVGALATLPAVAPQFATGMVASAGVSVAASEATSLILARKSLTPEQALQAGLIGEVGYVATVGALSGAGTVGATVWEKLPSAVTDPLETAAGFIRSVPGRVAEYLPSPLPEMREFLGNVAEDVGYQFRQRAPQSLLNLIYGSETGTQIGVEREFSWTEPVLGIRGVSQVSSREAFETWENLYAPTDVQSTAIRAWYRVYQGVSTTPMSVTLSRALEQTLPTKGLGGLSAEQVLEEVPKSEPSVSLPEMEVLPRVGAESSQVQALLGSLVGVKVLQEARVAKSLVRKMSIPARTLVKPVSELRELQVSKLRSDLLSDPSMVQVQSETVMTKALQTQSSQVMQEMVSQTAMPSVSIAETMLGLPSPRQSPLWIPEKRIRRKRKKKITGVWGRAEREWDIRTPEQVAETLLGGKRERKKKV